MTIKESLQELIDNLPDGRLTQLLEYGQFLSWQEERTGWQRFGKEQFARAYTTHEPEYAMEDLKGASN